MGCVSSNDIQKLYHLQKVKLGEGSFGVVWRGVNRRTGDVVAVKQLRKGQLAQKGIGRQETDREIRLMGDLQHRNIIRLHDTVESADSIYLALEYCDGGDFGDKVLERGEQMREPEAAYWVKQMLAAVSFMHSRRVCHRDVKLDNFLVAQGNRLKLADLGFAVEIPEGAVLTERCGTPSFMAPEVYSLPAKSKGYGLLVDVWSIGVSMYMVLFGGRHPFLMPGDGAKRRLDERRLRAGDLDFNSKVGSRKPSILGGLGLGISGKARRLCQQMITPSSRQRVAAVDALADPWFLQAAEVLEASPEAGPSKGFGLQQEVTSTPSEKAASPLLDPGSAEERQYPRILGRSLAPTPGKVGKARTH